MSRIHSPAEIANLSLRMVREIAPHESGADGIKLDTALIMLDMNVGQLSGEMTCWWLVPVTLSITLDADSVSYDLEDEPGYPADGLQFLHHAQLKNSSGKETPLDIIGRHEYEEIEDKDLAGTPILVYVERDANPKLYTYKTIAVTGYTLELFFQTYAADLTETHGTKNALAVEAAWNRWALYATAFDIGQGIIRSIPPAKLSMWRDEREYAKSLLSGFQNREKRLVRKTKMYNW
tara:strand:+ start:539 stop:1243 length:705 start_codon:yes stop_codon:yes gene_type:complete